MENTKEEASVVRPYLQVAKKMSLFLEKETWKAPYTIVTVDQPQGKLWHPDKEYSKEDTAVRFPSSEARILPSILVEETVHELN